MRPIRFDNWSRGAVNRSHGNRLPEAAVRELVNFDPSADGMLTLRAGYEHLHQGTDVRGAWSVGTYVVIADGVQLFSLNTLTNTSQPLGILASLAPLAGAVLNGRLYLSSLTDSLRTDGVTLSPWAVVAPSFDIETIDGAMPAGLYKVAVVAASADGEESGCDPQIIKLTKPGNIRVLSNDSRPLRVYVSPVNSSTLYYQGLLFGGAMAIATVRDDTERLTTGGLTSLPACSDLVAHHSILAGRAGTWLFLTSPMLPHLTDPVAGFFQYGAPVKVIAPTDGGLFVVADRTYFITGVETDQPSQRVLLDADADAVEGSATPLPDGRVAWFTRYGLAIGGPDGSITLPNRDTYAPDTAEAGASGLVEHAGNQLVVTTMRGVTSPNNLATGDFADLEI